MVALYRPGPIQFIPDYIERKHNPKLIKYLDPALEEILNKTYGILVYQDDLLMMAHKIAGYTWGEVDKFRKAVGKKIPAEMEAQKEKFIKGCIEHSKWPEKKAKEIWKWIEPFAAYGFNKAHSVSYGRIAYLTAYLKAHFPEIYLSAVLSSEQGDTEKVAETIAECKRIGISVLPPDVNESYSQFTVVKDNKNIRFGLVTIKNFGQGISTAIIDERKRGGKYKSLTDFLDRVKDRNLNKKSLESLIKAGALDCFGIDRGKMLGNMELLLQYNKEGAEKHSDQTSLFGLFDNKSSVPTLTLADVPDAEMKDKLTWEKELLGLYISGHPLEKYRDVITKKDIDIKKALATKKDGDSVILGIIINEVRTIQTKNNETMAFVTISDFSGTADSVVFPRVYREFRELISPDRCLAVKATVNTRNGEKSFILERMKGL
jgi:DNA polymerase-3 subunit alpha